MSLRIVGVLTLAATVVARPGAAWAAALPMRELASGVLGGICQPNAYLIEDATTWSSLWATVIVGGGPPPPVNFETEMVVGATMGDRPTGGYAVAIRSVEATTNRLLITVVYYAPPPDTTVTFGFTCPFQFVAVPKSELPPEFVVRPFLDSKFEPTAVKMTWPDLGSNYVYTLEYATSLGNNDWRPVEGWPGFSVTNRWTAPRFGATTRFYRLKAELVAP